MFQAKERTCMESFRWSTTKIYLKCHGEGGRLNHFKYFEYHKSYVNELLHCWYSKMSDSYFGVQSILLVSADFCLWKSKKWPI